ncbi:MAG: DUF1678 family protein [Euryarchaeota archaeon]
MTWEGVPIPQDPVERIRVLRVLREVYRREVKPELKETYRRIGGRTYGPYYVAYLKRVRSKGFDTPRLFYLGKENESVSFVRWLEERSKGFVLRLARLAVRHLRAALEKLVEEASGGGVGHKRVVRVLALAFELRPARSAKLRKLLRKAPGFARSVLGPWPAWFADRVLRRLLLHRTRDGEWVPDVLWELERWRLKGGG